MVSMLDLAVQIHKSEIRLFEPCPSKSAIYARVNYDAAELTSEPSLAGVYDGSNSVAGRSRGSCKTDHVTVENAAAL